MRKLVMVQKLKGRKEANSKRSAPARLDIYDIASNRHSSQFAPVERVVYRSSGLFGGEEISEVVNEFGVVFRVRRPV